MGSSIQNGSKLNVLRLNRYNGSKMPIGQLVKKLKGILVISFSEKEDALEGIFFQTFRNGEEEFEGFGEAHPDGDMRTAEIRA